MDREDRHPRCAIAPRLLPAVVGYARVVDTTDRVHPHEITGGRQTVV